MCGVALLVLWQISCGAVINVFLVFPYSKTSNRECAPQTVLVETLPSVSSLAEGDPSS